MCAATHFVSARNQQTIYTLATSFDGTRAALGAAIPLARGSRARLMILVPQIVPYPLPIDAPAEPAPFAAERYRQLLHQLHAEAEVRVCLCRHLDDVILQMLPSHATVVAGGPAGTWHASREERLARRLTHLGHRVVFAPIEEPTSEAIVETPTAQTYGMFDARSMGQFW